MYIKLSIEEDKIGVITVDRPESLNALNAQTLTELSEVLSAAENNEAVRVIIITGSGEKAFVAGADIKEFADYGSAEATAMSRNGHIAVFDKIARLSKPVIAAISGYALGGGLELALACHIRYAAEHARLGLPEVTLGLIPGYGGTQRLPALVGKGHANEIILSAKMISALKAKEIGLVNDVFSAAALMDETKALARLIAQNSRTAIAQAISVINASDTESGYEKEIKAFGQLFESADKKEGIAAFLAKRKPDFG